MFCILSKNKNGTETAIAYFDTYEKAENAIPAGASSWYVKEIGELKPFLETLKKKNKGKYVVYEDDVETTDEIDLSFYFGKEAKINIDAEERGRQFDAQYPTEDVLKKCCMMNDFGTQQKEVGEMWARVKSA